MVFQQQALAKAPWPAQEVVFALVDQLQDLRRLVDVVVAFLRISAKVWMPMGSFVAAGRSSDGSHLVVVALGPHLHDEVMAGAVAEEFANLSTKSRR